MIQQTIYLIDSNLFHRRIIREICLASLKKLAVQVQVKEITNLHYFHRIGISDGDIFIIDIELNDKYNGIEVSETIRKINKKCAILFLTSIEVSAAEIINKRIHPIAYLKKDLATFSSVRPKIEQVFEMIFSMKFEKKQHLDNLVIESRGNILNLNYSAINYIETCKHKRNFINIHTETGEILVRKNFSTLKEELPELYFCKNFKSLIINLLNIKQVERVRESITFKTGEELFVGKKIIDKVRLAYKKCG